MEDSSLAIYLDEIITQIRYMHFAGELYAAAVADSDNFKAFLAAQIHLGAAAIISKLLWPDPKDGRRGVKRGKALGVVLLNKARGIC